MILFGRHVVALFISADAAYAAEALSVAYDYLVVMSTFLLSAYVLHTYRSALQGMGFTTAPMLSRSDRVCRPCGCIAAADQGHR